MPLTRPQQPMPPDIQAALEHSNLLPTYQQRPPYQRNDYLAWIARAKRPETRQKRLQQMLTELQQGNRYMNMAWNSRDPNHET